MRCVSGRVVDSVRRPVIVFVWIPANQPFNQLLYVVIQLHHQCNCRNVSPKSFLLADMFNLLPQLSQAGPSWHASTPVGLPRHICCYLPSGPRLLAQEISSVVPLQIGDNWNISTAEATGGARPLCSVPTVRIDVYVV
jgi:hypothetical protein